MCVRVHARSTPGKCSSQLLLLLLLCAMTLCRGRRAHLEHRRVPRVGGWLEALVCPDVKALAGLVRKQTAECASMHLLPASVCVCAYLMARACTSLVPPICSLNVACSLPSKQHEHTQSQAADTPARGRGGGSLWDKN